MARPKQEWIPYEDVKKWVHKLKLKNYKEWLHYVKTHKLPEGIPKNPQITYGEDYYSDADFLGHSYYWSYSKAKRFARSLSLNNYKEWLEWHKENRPNHIPRYPDQFVEYQDEWESWGEFLGTGTISKNNRKYRPYHEALKWTHSRGLTSIEQWNNLNLPDDIPKTPSTVYEEWESWPVWFGKKLADRVIAETIDTSVFYIVRYHGQPANVVSIGLEKQGFSVLKEKAAKLGFAILAVFNYNKEMNKQIDHIINTHCQPWWETEDQHLVQNFYGLVDDLRAILDPVKGE